MRQILIFVEDSEFSKLKRLKKKEEKTWRELILMLLEVNQK